MVGRPVNRRAAPGGPRPCVAGFTLVELVVTLVLLGLLAAFAAPSIGDGPRGPATRRQLVEAARETAVRRAETLVLHVGAGGAWRLTSAGDSAVLSRGAGGESGPAAVFRLTPLGACFVLAPATTAAADLSSCDRRQEPR